MTTHEAMAGDHLIGPGKQLSIGRLLAFSGGQFGMPGWPAVSTHTDSGAAAAAGLRAPIAAGTQVESYLAALLVSHFGLSWFQGGRLDVRFIKPAYEGDTIVAHAVIGADTGVAGPWECEVWCENQDGERVATGTAIVPRDGSGPAHAGADIGTAG
jgi:acyl-coenzyme A thioesterase PaaI-like protein